MSYDLYLKPRQGTLDPQQIENYFRARTNYKVTASQIWYENPATGVYFLFEWQTPDDAVENEFYPILLNINFIRPSYFILEAEPEVSAFIHQFDLTVLDNQTVGMGKGEYQKDMLLAGWNHGNEFGISSVLQQPNSALNPVTFPTSRLIEIWSWNRNAAERQTCIGESKFVPQIMFIQIGGLPVAASVWPDGIPILIPPVDCFIVVRKQLAKKRLFRTVEDQTLLTFKDALQILEPLSISLPDHTRALNYDTPPEEVIKFIRSLPADSRQITGVPRDQVLDQELVAKYTS